MTREERYKHADDLREKALKCIRLADGAADKRAEQALRALGQDLIAQADEIEARVDRVLRGLQGKDPKK
jgi:hypothetical protein